MRNGFQDSFMFTRRAAHSTDGTVEPRQPVSLDQRTRSRTQRRRMNRSVTLQLHQHGESFAQDVAAEHAANIRSPGQLAAMKQLPADGGDESSQRLRRTVQNIARDSVTIARRFIHQRGVGCDPRARVIGRVEAMQQVIHVGRAGGFEQCFAQCGRVPPAFFLAQRRAHRLPHQVERAALIAEHVAPAAGARGAAFRIAAVGDRTGARDRDHARLAAGRAQQRNHRVVGDAILFRRRPTPAPTLLCPPDRRSNPSRPPRNALPSIQPPCSAAPTAPPIASRKRAWLSAVLTWLQGPA